MMSEKEQHIEFEMRLLKFLGLESARISKLEITINAGERPIIIAHCIAPDENGNPIIEDGGFVLIERQYDVKKL
jgi:hypothetical protein